MDQVYLLKAAAYVALNPVKTKRMKSARDYRWRRAHAYIKGKVSREIVEAQKLLEICGDWKTYLKQSQSTPGKTFESHLNTGRPLEDVDIIKKIEQLLGRDLIKKARAKVKG